MTKLTLNVDDDLRENFKSFSRMVSISSVVRVLLCAVMTTDKQFDEYLKKNPEAREVKEWLRPKLQKLLA